MPKRKSTGEVVERTPKKAPVDIDADELAGTATPSKQYLVADTPSKQRSILKNPHNGIVNGGETPRSVRKVLFSTPARALETVVEVGTESPLTAARNADRSARKKSSRKLFQGDDAGIDEEDDIEEDVARQILDTDDEDERESDELEQELEQDAAIDGPIAPDTPSTHAKLRGRPKGKRRVPSPTPLEHLPPHELYFFQNRPGSVKTSTNSFGANAILDHDEYNAQINAYSDPHEEDRMILTQMHEASFEQWTFELEQGFNICLYGYGSKRELLLDFAEYLYANPLNPKKPSKIVIVNGYDPSVNLRDILTLVSTTLLGPVAARKLPLQVSAHLDALLAYLASSTTEHSVHLLIHSIDGPALRRHQQILSRLASSPYITLIASADTPNFPLLWDISLRSALRFVFHDTTTYAPYTAEFDVVDEVNALLGRSGRRVGGKDGVAYVLRSLPENARNLFRILVAEQLALADADNMDMGSAASFTTDMQGFGDELGNEGEDDDEDFLGHAEGHHAFDMDIETEVPDSPTKRRVRKGRPAKRDKATPQKQQQVQLMQHQGVEYRTLYHKAVEEFVCSSEMSFRTLLREFHDHAMLESRRDAQGTERLSVPFARDELEEILSELV
ncbi:hypothetical protein AAFC00_002701 [Neodothiora populina]|uniref:Origin recognition complex subunit 2 n=1 Tax=Neodothiora populina TaxID=2781224 RepID=A0ABR3P7X8_9PEZI